MYGSFKGHTSPVTAHHEIVRIDPTRTSATDGYTLTTTGPYTVDYGSFRLVPSVTVVTSKIVGPVRYHSRYAPPTLEWEP